MIVDEAEEDLEMEEDPFHEEELPAVLDEENCFKKSVSRESRISVLERLERLEHLECLEKAGTIAEANESDGVTPGDDPDKKFLFRQVSFLVEDEENSKNDSTVTEMTEMTV